MLFQEFLTNNGLGTAAVDEYNYYSFSVLLANFKIKLLQCRTYKIYESLNEDLEIL
jgi:hypothetical protein